MPGKKPRTEQPTSRLAQAAELRKAANDTLSNMGITRTKDGGVVLSADALRTIQEERQRRMTVSRFPSTPRWMPREAGGVGVRKGSGKWGAISMETLRMVRERAPMLQAIHNARDAQVRRMSVRWSGRRGDVGWRVVHKDHYELDAKPPDGFDPWVKRFEKLLEAPAPTYGLTSTSPLLGMLEEDLLTLNRPVTEVLYSALDKRRVVGFRPVDAALVWPTQLWIEKWVSDHPDWYGPWSPAALTEDDALDLLSTQMELDLRTAEYCLVRDGIVEQTYDRHQLLVAPSMNRTDINLNGYWPSKVEMALEIILTFINTWDYNASFFTRGMMAEFILGVTGNVHDDDVDAFADMLRDATQGVKRAWQPPIMPLPEGGAIEKIDLKPANREMMYEVFQSLQIALAAAIYRMDPSTVNARPWDAGGGSRLGGDGGRGMEIALAKEEGLQGDLQHLAEAVFTPLARRCHPDLRVVFEYGDFDPQKEASIYEVRARTSITRNEVRLAEGLEPMGFWVPTDEIDDLSDEDREKYESNLWNMPADQGFVSAMQQQAQMRAMQAQQAMYGDPNADPNGEEQPPDDGFGEPDDGADDGFGGKPPSAPFGARPGGQPQPPPSPGQRPGTPPGPSRPTPPSGGAQPMQKGARGRVGGAGGKRRVTVYVESWTE